MDNSEEPEDAPREQAPNGWSDELVAEARRQSRAVAKSPVAAEDQAFVDAFTRLVLDEDG
jgi:hypothetical protein